MSGRAVEEVSEEEMSAAAAATLGLATAGALRVRLGIPEEAPLTPVDAIKHAVGSRVGEGERVERRDSAPPLPRARVPRRDPAIRVLENTKKRATTQRRGGAGYDAVTVLVRGHGAT